MKNLPVSTTDECRTSLEILRYTQDDNEEENKRNKHIACHSEERKPPRHPEERSDAGIYLCEDAERNGRLSRAKALAMTR